MATTAAILVPIASAVAGGLASGAMGSAKGGGGGGGGGGSFGIPGSSSSVGGGQNPFLQALSKPVGNAAALLASTGLNKLIPQSPSSPIGPGPGGSSWDVYRQGERSASTPPFVPSPPPMMMTPPFSGQTPSYAQYDPTLAQLFQSFQG